MAAVAAQNVTKIFGQGDGQVVALKDAQLSIEPGEIVALMGPSGSGKTTLLRALSLIDPPTAGQIAIANQLVFDGEWVLTDDRKLRRQRMGIIFQAYNLIPFLTSLENVALVLTLNGISLHEAMTRASELLKRGSAWSGPG